MPVLQAAPLYFSSSDQGFLDKYLVVSRRQPLHLGLEGPCQTLLPGISPKPSDHSSSLKMFPCYSIDQWQD